MQLSAEHDTLLWLTPADAREQCTWPRAARAIDDAVRLLRRWACRPARGRAAGGLIGHPEPVRESRHSDGAHQMTNQRRDRHVVITGGDGALGQAVVAAFVATGATCHLPIFGQTPTSPTPGVQLSGPVNLSDEAAVAAYFAGLPPLAASIHLAGGFRREADCGHVARRPPSSSWTSTSSPPFSAVARRCG